MKESKFLKALEHINQSLPRTWDDDGNEVLFNILQCDEFFEMDESMKNESHLKFEDGFSKRLNLTHKKASPTDEMWPLIEAKVQKVTEDEFEMLFAIGWSTGSYSSPQIFAYHILKQTKE